MKEHHGKQHDSEASIWKAVYAAEESGTEAAGDWCYYETETCRYLMIVIPGHGPMLWQFEGDGKTAWDYSGPEDGPSLHPSLMVNRGKPDQWHGYFKKGVLQEI